MSCQFCDSLPNATGRLTVDIKGTLASYDQVILDDINQAPLVHQDYMDGKIGERELQGFYLSCARNLSAKREFQKACKIIQRYGTCESVDS